MEYIFILNSDIIIIVEFRLVQTLIYLKLHDIIMFTNKNMMILYIKFF